VRSFQLPIPKPTFDPENERQNRNALQQHLQELSQVNEGALAFTDITLADASSVKHGLLPKLPNDATKYLDGSGNWSSPGGSATGTGWSPLNWTMPFQPLPAALVRSAWTASASASGGGAAANAIDGNDATKWATGAAVVPNTTYFEVDMGSAVSVASFQYHDDAGSSPNTGNVQWSDDNSTWTTIASWTTLNSAGAYVTQSWTAASHRYWRLLATSTPTVGTNWWSIYELNFYASAYLGPVFELAHQSFDLTPQTVVWARGLIRKTAVTDTAIFGIGLDTDNWYGIIWGDTSASLLLVKSVAGTRTTLETITFESDTEGHEIEMSLVVPNGASIDNWFTVKATRTNNPVASGGYHDSALDFTNGGLGSLGAGKFIAYGTVDAPYRGWSYAQLASVYSPTRDCTWATGGDYIYQDGNYQVHVFTNPGTFKVLQGGTGTLDVRVVAAGGGGNGYNGGGAGGYSALTTAQIAASYAVTVGTGGVAGGGAGSGGGNSSFGSTTVTGGGAGGSSAGGGSGTYGGGTAMAVSVGCVDSPPTSLPCSAGVAVGGGGGSPGGNGTDASISYSSDCTVGYCGATGAWGAGGAGTHLDIGAYDSITYTGFDLCLGGYGSGAATGGGGVSGPTPGTLAGWQFGNGGGGASSGSGNPGGNGVVIVRYLYDPTVCG